jgi:hypothetical protein
MVLSTILKKMLIGRAFTNEKGRIRLYGRMDWMLYPARAFALNLQSIGEKLGKDYLYKIGYEAGYDAGKEIVKCTGAKLKGGWVTQKIVLALLDFIGFGEVEFIKADIKKDGHHHIIIHTRNNPVIEHGAKLYGKKSMICYWFMGVYGAHGEVELGVKNPKLVENKCIRHGSPYCEWESKW